MWETIILSPMVNILLWIYRFLGDYGITIILFTLLIRLATHPFTVQSLKGASAMQELQASKEYQDLQKKYKDDKQKLQTEQAKLLQEKGINPVGSCLPTLLQLPIIFGLYQSITRTLAATPLQMLQLAKNVYPFTPASALIPIKSHFLWMELGEPERLVLFGVGIPVLTILVVITTYMQSRVMAPPSGAATEQSAQMTQNMMNIYMPILMGWISYTLASGLAIYFVTTNIFSIGQYAALGKVNWGNLIPKADWLNQLLGKPTSGKKSIEKKK